MLTPKRERNIFPSVFFNFLTWVCLSRNLRLAYFAIVWCNYNMLVNLRGIKLGLQFGIMWIWVRVIPYRGIQDCSSRLSRFEARHVPWEIWSLALAEKICAFGKKVFRYSSIKFCSEHGLLLFSDIFYVFSYTFVFRYCLSIKNVNMKNKYIILRKFEFVS